jgi:hypothetical protein
MPFIIRNGSRHDRYVLVGEAYMHGYMDGEMEGLGLEARDIFLE